MFKRIGSLVCVLALAAFIAGTIAEAAGSSNASNNAAGGTKVVPKAKVKQLKEKK
ncbi:MAG: hypothetical protein HY097_00565 [Nitrospinae bacterium]|nr:hypothetical protein [Nitrospinota bacterium]